MARRPAAGAGPAKPFTQSLLLARAFAARLGGRYDEILSSLCEASQGRSAAGPSHFAAILLARQSLAVAPADLAAWDAAIGEHEARLAHAREDFRLTHFQWLACLATEWHLDAMRRDRVGHVAALEAFRASNLGLLSPYTAADANKLACFMATGAGKTLVLHLNLLQFLHHGLFQPQNILLLTPNEALSAQHERELTASGLAHLPVRVAEITKFFVDGSGVKRPRKGVSEGVSRYEGPNLLLVDEGHKGGTAEAGTERQWRAVREALAAGATDDKAGFTFEYSATFAQIAAKDAALYDEYAKCIAVDFGYARFYREGYGKEPRVLNARDAEGADRTLAAGLIHFYQQRRAYADHPDRARDYQIEAPLLACVGRDVTASNVSDVVELARFLARAAFDGTWLAHHFQALSGWSRPSQGDLSGDPLDFSYALSLGLSPMDLAADLQARVFGGTGHIEARLVSEKEIGLRSLGAPNDAYFGVIRVGEAKKLLGLLASAGIATGEPERVAGSLFSRLDEDERLSLLIGAKMFVEGWSSWRVSALGLMNVGRSPGAEIIQLFGRGVRLKGRAWSLKREAAPPPAVALLQTLCVFGVRADYMQQYLEALWQEGARPKVFYVDVAPPSPPLASLGLSTLALDDAPFREPCVFDPDKARPVVETIAPLLEASRGLAPAQALDGAPRRFPVDTNGSGMERLFQQALSLKTRYNWGNLFIAAPALEKFLCRCAVEAPGDYFDDPGLAEERRARIAATCVEKGLAGFMRAEERRWRMARLAAVPLSNDNAGLPWSMEGSERRLRYRLEVDVADNVAKALYGEAEKLFRGGLVEESFLHEVQALLTRHVGLVDVAGRVEALLESGGAGDEDTGPPLPRLYFERHLYQPLLLAQPMQVSGGQLALFDATGNVPTGVRLSPPGLNEGEARFVWDLRAFWQAHCEEAAWRDTRLYLLRNPAGGGITLFRQEGFAPDFMLWLKRGETQVLAFVDPKGLGRVWPEDKIEMLKDLPSLPVSLPVRGYIVTPTAPENLALLPGITADAESLAKECVLLQTGDYVARLLLSLVAALPRNQT
jgi:hypothetical protein